MYLVEISISLWKKAVDICIIGHIYLITQLKKTNPGLSKDSKVES
jgi:hypothetical protein